MGGAGVPAGVAAAGVHDGEAGVLLGQVAHELGERRADIVRHNGVHGVALSHVADHVWCDTHT